MLAAVSAPSVARAEEAAAPLVLERVGAVGAPVLSSDGRFVAVREADGRVALIDVAAARVAGAGYEPRRFAAAPAAKRNPHDRIGVGRVAAFSADGEALVLAGEKTLVRVATAGGEAAALAGAPAGAVAWLGATADGTWPVLRADETKGWTVPRASFVTAGGELIAGPAVRPGAARLTPDGRAVLATAADGSAVRIDAATGKAVPIATLDAVAKAVGKPIERVTVLAASADGERVLVQAERPFPERMRGMTGTYVPGGDEKPERGRNPGSAEPGPAMPRYVFVAEEGKLTLIKKVCLARWLDTLLLAPARELDRFVALQVANDGGAGSGVPHMWLGTIDRGGAMEDERDLGRATPEKVDAPRFELLATNAKGTRALALMRANREADIDLDAPAWKKALAKFPREMASIVLMQHYDRAGASQRDSDGHVLLEFAQWSLWEIDAEAGAIRRVSPDLGEKIAGWPDETGLPGAPGRAAYSARAGLLAVVLHRPAREDEPRGLVLLSAPPPE